MKVWSSGVRPDCTGAVVVVSAPARSVACTMTGVRTGVAGLSFAIRGSSAGAYDGDPGGRYD